LNHRFKLERQQALPVIWENKKLNIGFRADLIVSGKVLIEIKSVEGIAPVHYKQVLTYRSCLKTTRLIPIVV
jgi:GxxExxY protein